MSAFRETFTERHSFFPVVHLAKRDKTLRHNEIQTVLRNVDIAQSCDADGVFLINHGRADADDVIEAYHHVRSRYPDFWVGINLLGISNREALSMMPENDCALWSDHGGVSDTSEAEASDFKHARAASGWKGMYFGSVAFKYQAPVMNRGAVAKRAVPYMDAIVTSGRGTGFAPDPADIIAMKYAVGEHPLIIASGMTPENVHDFREADGFLVATGISKSFTELDASKVLAFARKLDHSPYEPHPHKIAS